MLGLPTVMDTCVTSVKLSLDAQRGGRATGYCSLRLLLTGSGFYLYQRSKTGTGPKYIGCVPIQPGRLCVCSTAIHEFPKDYFTNKERIEGAVGLHVLCVSIT